MFFRGVMRIDVVFKNLDELGYDVIALERRHQPSIDVYRRLRLLERSRQRDADVRVLRLARSVDDTAHDRDLHLFHARVTRLPRRHLLTQVPLDLLRHLLEKRTRGAPASRTSRYLRIETTDTHRLQNLLPDGDFFCAVPIRSGSQRHSNGIANPFLHYYPECCRTADNPRGAHPGFGQPKVQWILASPCQFAIHVDQVLYAADLRAENDLVFTKSVA